MAEEKEAEETVEGSTQTVGKEEVTFAFDFFVTLGALVVAALANLQLRYASAREAAGTLAGFAGPLVSLSVLGVIQSSRLGKSSKDNLQQKVLTFLFASASAGVVVNYLGTLDLLVLNATGAFFDAFFTIFNKVARRSQRKGENAFELLEEFRGTFFGVWTSYSGLALIAASDFVNDGPPKAIIYCVATLITSLISTEAGYRFAALLDENGFLKGADIIQFSLILPHLAAYVVCNTLVAYGSTQLVVCYLFSTIGCYVGALIDNGSLAGPLVNNIVATAVAFAVVVQCTQTPDACTEPFVPEFVNSLCGASSAYTSTSSTTHAFLVASLPTKVLNEWYYDEDSVGSMSMLKHYSMIPYKKRYGQLVVKAIGDWVVSVSFALAAGALNLEVKLV